MSDDFNFNGGKVYFLFNDDDRKSLSALLEQERGRIDRRLNETDRDLGLVKSASTVMDDILLLLARMKQLAIKAKRGKIDRERLSVEFELLKNEIDVTAAKISDWPEADRARLQALLDSADSLSPDDFFP